MDCFANCILILLFLIILIFIIRIPETFDGNNPEDLYQITSNKNNKKCKLQINNSIIPYSDNEHRTELNCNDNAEGAQVYLENNKIFTNLDGKKCGLEWDARMNTENKRVAKWDCNGQGDDIIRENDGFYSNVNNNKCGLQIEDDFSINWQCPGNSDNFLLESLNSNSNLTVNNVDGNIEFPTIGIIKTDDNEISVNKLGIGTTDPQSHLNIKGDNDGSEISLYQNDPDHSASIKLKNGSTTILNKSGSNPNIKFDIKDNDVIKTVLYANKEGNIGIGTINPTRKLDVNGPAKMTHISADGLCFRNRNNPDSLQCLNHDKMSGIRNDIRRLSNQVNSMQNEIRTLRRGSNRINAIENRSDSRLSNLDRRIRHIETIDQNNLENSSNINI